MAALFNLKKVGKSGYLMLALAKSYRGKRSNYVSGQDA